MIVLAFRRVLTCLVCVLGSIQAGARTFTNTAGKTIEGEVVSVSTTQAVIERTLDRKRFTIPLASLSVADREFLARWRDENPEFALAFDVVKETGNRKNTREGMSKTRSCDVQFRISVTNRGKSPTSPATILYRNHFESESVEVSPDGAEKPKPDPSKPAQKKLGLEDLKAKEEGAVELPAIDPGKTVTVTTKPVNLVEASDITITRRKTQMGIIEDQHVRETKETIEGISFVIHHQGQEVATWTTPGSDEKLAAFQTSLRRAEKKARGEGK